MEAQGGMRMRRQVGERKRRLLERKEVDCLATFKSSGLCSSILPCTKTSQGSKIQEQCEVRYIQEKCLKVTSCSVLLVPSPLTHFTKNL